jgi:biopolymer transport protein ExbB
VLLLMFFFLSAGVFSAAFSPPALYGQGDTIRDFTDDEGEQARRRSLLDVVADGGLIGGVIILLSVAAVGLIIEHSISIRRGRLMPELVMFELEELIQNHDIDNAIDCCEAAGEDCLAAVIVRAALVRYKGAKFGFAEYKAAAEEAGELHTSRLYRKTTPLALIAAIAPMLGLSGTVLGMITAFNKIAETGGMARPDELAGGIGQALITTLMGLFVAMPAMIAVGFFRDRVAAIVGEVGKRIEQILLPLSRER